MTDAMDSWVWVFFVLVFLGRCARAERAAERHSDPAGRVDLRGAARLEAASEDRLHRWPAKRLRGPAAELVSPSPSHLFLFNRLFLHFLFCLAINLSIFFILPPIFNISLTFLIYLLIFPSVFFHQFILIKHLRGCEPV